MHKSESLVSAKSSRNLAGGCDTNIAIARHLGTFRRRFFSAGFGISTATSHAAVSQPRLGRRCRCFSIRASRFTGRYRFPQPRQRSIGASVGAHTPQGQVRRCHRRRGPQCAGVRQLPRALRPELRGAGEPRARRRCRRHGGAVPGIQVQSCQVMTAGLACMRGRELPLIVGPVFGCLVDRCVTIPPFGTCCVALHNDRNYRHRLPPGCAPHVATAAQLPRGTPAAADHPRPATGEVWVRVHPSRPVIFHAGFPAGAHARACRRASSWSLVGGSAPHCRW